MSSSKEVPPVLDLIGLQHETYIWYRISEIIVLAPFSFLSLFVSLLLSFSFSLSLSFSFSFFLFSLFDSFRVQIKVHANARIVLRTHFTNHSTLSSRLIAEQKLTINVENILDYLKSLDIYLSNFFFENEFDRARKIQTKNNFLPVLSMPDSFSKNVFITEYFQSKNIYINI